MRVAFGSAAIAALVAIGAAGAATITFASGPTIPDCYSQAVAPADLTLTCGDGNYALARMSWQHWGRATALGSGSATANDCKPNCAAGKFRTYGLTATAGAIRTCRSGRAQYTKLTLVYPGARPPGIKATDVWRFPCDAPAPGPLLKATARPGGKVVLTGSFWERSASCDLGVSLTYRGGPKAAFADPTVGKNLSFAYTWKAPSGAVTNQVVVARQECHTAALGGRLFETSVTVTIR